MTDKEMCTRIQTVIDRWPLIRRSLSEVVSSRRLELVDEIIYDIHAAITDWSHNEG